MMNAKKHPEIGFDSVLGSIWEGFGTVWGVLGALPGASWPFWGRSKSIFFQTWVQDRLQKAFWIHLGSILGRFGEHLAKNLGRFRSFRPGRGQTWGLAKLKTDFGGPPAHSVGPHISYRNPRAASLLRGASQLKSK